MNELSSSHKGTAVPTSLETSQDPVVTILLKNCHQYRVGFYEYLREILDQKGIRLRLVVGTGLAEDVAKGDTVDLPWAETRRFTTLKVAGKELLWQPGFDLVRESDLIITEQASKQIFNAVLASLPARIGARFAFWGHGNNFQSSIEGTAGDGLKRWMTKRAHWFFSYNELSTRAAVGFGMDLERVTAVMNSTDTEHIRATRAALPADTPERVRQELGLGAGPVGLYLGGVYGHKRPEFLVASAEQIRRLIPDFQMLVIGSGSKANVMEDAAQRHDWFHHVGACYGDEKVALASVASIQLMPGLVGLNIVDAFAMGLPTITTNIDYHSPEIEYLVNGVNGVVTAENATPREFGTAAADLLDNETLLAELSAGAEESGRSLTAENMAQRFADGVVQALL